MILVPNFTNKKVAISSTFLLTLSLALAIIMTMNAIAFDMLPIAKRLKSSGFTEPQAEALAMEIQKAAKKDQLLARQALDTECEKIRKQIGKMGLKLVLTQLVAISAVSGLFIVFQFS